MSDDHLLDIVDEQDEVIGQAMRSDIHRDGLLHREVHVWLVDKHDKVFFQKRAAHKQEWPGLLGPSAAGHVDPGESYVDGALREMAEEIGWQVSAHVLHPLIKIKVANTHKHSTNCCFREVFWARYPGDVSDLTVDTSEGEGLMAIPLSQIAAGAMEDKLLFPTLLNEVYLPVWQQLKVAVKG